MNDPKVDPWDDFQTPTEVTFDATQMLAAETLTDYRLAGNDGLVNTLSEFETPQRVERYMAPVLMYAERT